MPQHSNEIPEDIRASLTQEESEYFKKHLTGPHEGYGYTTGLRRAEVLSGDEGKARFFTGYYFSDALDRLNRLKSQYADSDAWPLADRMKYLGQMFTVLDTRALPMSDAQIHIPELRPFAKRYRELSARYKRKIEGIDLIAEDSRLPKQKLREWKLAQYVEAFKSSYYDLEELLVWAHQEYGAATEFWQTKGRPIIQAPDVPYMCALRADNAA